MFVVKKLRLIKNLKANGLLRKLEIRTTLSNIPPIGQIIFLIILNKVMNKVVNKFFLVGDKFLPELPLYPPGIVPADHLLNIVKEFKHL